MEHGRDHDERRQKAEAPRSQDTLERAADDETGAPPTEGSEYAPTAQATRRERERHRLERERGRVAGGTAGFVRDTRSPAVTRETLKEAAKEADERVAGRPLRGAGGDEPTPR